MITLCYYLHDHRDYSKKLLPNQHLHAVHLFSTLCWHYDGIQKQLQSASNQKRTNCANFSSKRPLIFISKQVNWPHRKQAMPLLNGPADTFLPAQVSSSMPHGCSIKLEATLHFQILSVNLLKQPMLWNQLNHEWHLRQQVFKQQNVSAQQLTVSSHQKKQLLQKHTEHLAHKTKIKLNQHYQEMPKIPYYPRHSKSLPDSLRTLKNISTSPAFTLQLMSLEQLLDYGRQALHTLKILKLYEQKILIKIITRPFHGQCFRRYLRK